MSDKTKTGGTFCEIAGCSGAATTSRWVVVEKEGKREIDVCWKHAEGDIDAAGLEPWATA